MEEKERYKLEGFDTSKGIIDKIYDTEKDIFICDDDNIDIIVDLLNQQNKENQQLNQQLHDLPKKIVGDVEKCFTEYLPLKDKTGAGFYARLNAILRKYGGENE